MSNRNRAFFSAFFLAVSVSASAPKEVERLSPVLEPSHIPAQCRVASVLPDSPAEKAQIAMGDILESINGQSPADASGLSDLVMKAPDDAAFTLMKKDGTTQQVQVHLNPKRPRLGAVCDLSGWVKPGVTAAGNESVTLFDGPYALTASGIIDKDIVFLRVRVANDFNHPLDIGPGLFNVTDGTGQPMKILTPKDVMCKLYGDKGAHLLALKKVHQDTLDAHEGIQGMQSSPDEHCEAGPQGTLHDVDSEFAEANAKYLATESLWPARYKSGDAADGLIYLAETHDLPVTLTGTLEGRSLTIKLGTPKGSDKRMKHSELTAFLAAQKKGTSLRLTLKKGKVFVGKLQSYDSDNERVWFTTPAGLLNTTSFSVDSIQYAEPLEQIPAKPAAD